MSNPGSPRLYLRLTRYLNHLKQMPEDAPDHISATAIAKALGLNHVQVRKDLAAASSRGRPKVGYLAKDLILDIEKFLGYGIYNDAVLVGVGNLGKALLSHGGLENYGLAIVSVFDTDPNIVGKRVEGRRVVHVDGLTKLCQRTKVKIGIVTVPAGAAQDVTDALVAGGVRAIWNFAPTNLTTPVNVVVRNEDMAASLAILIKQWKENLAKYGTDNISAR